MTKASKALSMWLAIAVLAGCIPSANRSIYPTSGLPEAFVQSIPLSVQGAAREAITSGQSLVDIDLILANPSEVARLKQTVIAIGGELVLEDHTYVRARVPIASLESIPQSAKIVAMGVTNSVNLHATSIAAEAQVDPNAAAESIAQSLEPLGVSAFRTFTGADGRGVKIAVVDSGIDPAHPSLLRNPDGSAKIIDWKDFTREGRVDLTEVVLWGSSYTATSGEVFRLPALGEAAPVAVRFGYWNEATVPGVINRDLDRNGLPTDRFGVLAMDMSGGGQFDTVYVDTNSDLSFLDEVPLHAYQDSPTVAKMGRFREGRLAAQRLNFVVTDIHQTGRWVTFGFDGFGHGTQMAGVIAANGPGSYAGVAPAAQVLALKAIRSDGIADWSAIFAAIKYAAENGAEIINVSIGGLTAASRFDWAASNRIAAESLNRLVREHGVLIILAADNTGPGLSTGATIGSPSELLSVGAYFSPAMWKRDFGYIVPTEGVHWISGMGPRLDGAYLPGVVAPGGSPTTSPQWLHESGFATAVGTSVATAHASGAAALLTDAGRRRGYADDYASIKRSMELGALPIDGLAVYEQGHGTVKLFGAYDWLTKGGAVPSIQARSLENGEGLLARSYRPGSTEFTLTNLGKELVRVNVVSSSPWLQPGLRSMTLPVGLPRPLPLALNPPSEPGVHSAFLTLNLRDRIGSTSTIPFTYVQPQEFPASKDHLFSTRDRLEVTRSKRYFFDIKPGTPEFKVSLVVLPGPGDRAQGTVKVSVFRPDGQAVYESPELGANGRGLSGLFENRNPIEGVWEVVVTALPDRQGEFLHAEYAMEAQGRPGPVGSRPLQLVQAPGTIRTHQVRLTNTFGAFTGRAEVLGMTQTEQGIPWRVEHKPYLIEDFMLTEVAKTMRLDIATPVPLDVDLDLKLYRQDSSVPGGYAVVSQSITRGSSQETIEVANLPPGRYHTDVTIHGDAPQALQYQYRRLVASDRYDAWTDDPIRRRNVGESWMVNVTISAPNSPGRYRGQILVRDTDRGHTLGWIPFEISIGQPTLLVEALAAQLVQGRPSTVVLELRDSRDQRVVDGQITVNGERFVSKGGRVTVPVMPQGVRHLLQVASNMPAYQFMQREIVVPVHGVTAIHPTGVGANEENSLWRRKVQTQWP